MALGHKVLHNALGDAPMTEKPRITVTLEREDYELVKEVARVSGMTMSRLLGDYVEMSRPMLRHMVDLANAYDKADQERKAIHLAAIEAHASPQVVDYAQGQLDFALGFMDLLTKAADGQVRGAGGGGLVVDTTPTVNNMGVRLTECLPVEGKEVDKTKPKTIKKKKNNKAAQQ